MKALETSIAINHHDVYEFLWKWILFHLPEEHLIFEILIILVYPTENINKHEITVEYDNDC